MQVISERFAITVLFIVLFVFLLLHIVVLAGLLPFDFIWGGRLQTREEVVSFEIVSIFINLVFVLIAAIKARQIKHHVNSKPVQAALWVMFVLFTLNTVANVLSTNRFEQLVFSPLTLILALMCLRLVWYKKKS